MKTYFTLLINLIFIVGFSQNNQDKIRLMSVSNVNYYYKYDDLGRVLETYQNDKKLTEHYLYLGDSAIVKQYVEFIDTTLAGILLLNENRLGYVETKIYSDVVLVIENEYDKNNQLILQKVSSDKQKSFYTMINKDGNTIEQIGIDTIYENGKFQIQKRVVKSTFSDKINPLQNNVNGFVFKSKENKNLLIGDKFEMFSSDYCDQLPCPFILENKQLINYKYDYVFDVKGRIITHTSTNLNTNEIKIAKYYYY